MVTPFNDLAGGESELGLPLGLFFCPNTVKRYEVSCRWTQVVEGRMEPAYVKHVSLRFRKAKKAKLFSLARCVSKVQVVQTVQGSF